MLILNSREDRGPSYRVRVRFDECKPNVIYIEKKKTSGNAKAQVSIDILCLHRYVVVQKLLPQK